MYFDYKTTLKINPTSLPDRIHDRKNQLHSWTYIVMYTY